MATLVIRNASQLVGVSLSRELAKRGPAMRDIAVIEDGAVVVEGDRIAWVGPTTRLPVLPAGVPSIDASGQTVFPGFVDSHTHLVFAGSRHDEFERRLAG